MEVIEHELYGHKVLQVLNVLDEETFTKLQTEKLKLYVHENVRREPSSFDYNFYNIRGGRELDNWVSVVGQCWVDYCKIIRQIIKDYYGLDVYLNILAMQMINQPDGKKWHMHGGEPYRYEYGVTHPPTYNRDNYLCSVYYNHVGWDEIYDQLYLGRLRVAVDPEDKGMEFPCYSNSAIIHNAHFGHACDKVIQGSDIKREPSYTEWKKV